MEHPVEMLKVPLSEEQMDAWDRLPPEYQKIVLDRIAAVIMAKALASLYAPETIT